MKHRLMHWMNDHTKTAVSLLCAVGYSLHVLYEVLSFVHDGKPVPIGFILLQGLIVFVGAGIAGWAIDLVFTKTEKEVGEID